MQINSPVILSKQHFWKSNLNILANSLEHEFDLNNFYEFKIFTWCDQLLWFKKNRKKTWWTRNDAHINFLIDFTPNIHKLECDLWQRAAEYEHAPDMFIGIFLSRHVEWIGFPFPLCKPNFFKTIRTSHLFFHENNGKPNCAPNEFIWSIIEVQTVHNGMSKKVLKFVKLKYSFVNASEQFSTRFVGWPEQTTRPTQTQSPNDNDKLF